MRKADKKWTKTVAQLPENGYLYIIIDSHDGSISQR